MSNSGLYCTSCDGWTEPREDGRCIMCGLPALREIHIDAVAAVLTNEAMPPSKIGRRAKLSTFETRRALAWLVSNHSAVAVGTGAWMKYRTRRAGEVTW